MRLVICWLMLLPIVTAVPIRDALSTTTGKTIYTIMTAHKNPPNKPEKGQDSQDLSDQSFESANQDTIAEPAVSGANLGGESKDLDSDETPRRQMGTPLVNRRRPDQDQQSSSLKRKASAGGDTSKELTDTDSLETRPASVIGCNISSETREFVSSEIQPFGPGLRGVGSSPS
ncbi:uncharacterized protein LOC144057761 [Vanacampus margaritifer]